MAALERAGHRVWKISGPALPDLLVRTKRGTWQPLGVKTPTIARLTPAERAGRCPWPLVQTPQEALHALKRSKR